MYNSYSETAVGVSLIIFYIILYLIIIGVAVAGYVLSSLSLYKIAKRRQISKPWLAWVPVGDYWIVGSIADEYESHFGINKKWRTKLLVTCLVFFATFILFYIASIVLVIVAIINARHIDISEIFGGFMAVVIVMLAMYGFAILTSVFYYMALYKVYRSTVPEKSVLYLMLSIFVPFANAICLFLCRDKGYSVPSMYYGNQNPTQYPQNYQ